MFISRATCALMVRQLLLCAGVGWSLHSLWERRWVWNKVGWSYSWCGYYFASVCCLPNSLSYSKRFEPRPSLGTTSMIRSLLGLGRIQHNNAVVTQTINTGVSNIFWQRTTTIVVGWFMGHAFYKCGCSLHNTTWWATQCSLDTPYIVSIGWMREFNELERIWKQMWHNSIQHPNMCLKKFRKMRRM
jgi:hypothetical protein